MKSVALMTLITTAAASSLASCARQRPAPTEPAVDIAPVTAAPVETPAPDAATCPADPAVPQGEEFEGFGWEGLVCEDGVQIGVLDNQIESPGWELLIVARRGDNPFELRGRLRKVYYFAMVTRVESRGGRLTITIDLDDDFGAGVVPGLYHYASDDGGVSFGDPQYAPRRTASW